MDYGDVSYSRTTSLEYYVKEEVRNVKKCMKDKNMEFKKKISDINHSPRKKFYADECRLELGTSAECT